MNRRATAAIVTISVTIVVLVAFIAIKRHQHRPPLTAKPRTGEVSVADMLRPTITEGVTRGYVVDLGLGAGFPPRLCDGLTRRHPPDCLGAFLELANFDMNRLVVKTAKDAKGRTVAWTPNPVSIAGKRRAGTLTVVDILP